MTLLKPSEPEMVSSSSARLQLAFRESVGLLITNQHLVSLNNFRDQLATQH